MKRDGQPYLALSGWARECMRPREVCPWIGPELLIVFNLRFRNHYVRLLKIIYGSYRETTGRKRVLV